MGPGKSHRVTAPIHSPEVAHPIESQTDIK